MDKNLTITIVTACYNEVENVRNLVQTVNSVMTTVPEISFKHLFIDNASTDGTVDELRLLASLYPHVQVILNNRNYGYIRSPMHGVLQATGDAVIRLAADFQDPPELIPELVERWKKGHKAVICVKKDSAEKKHLFFGRTLYYRILRRLSDSPIIEHYTGFGIYDRSIIELLRELDDPYPFFRGLISEFGFATELIEFKQAERKAGKSKSNFYSLLDAALLGITKYSKVPLRIAMLTGLFSSGFFFLTGGAYLIYKLLYWDSFELGVAPLIIGLFFFGGLQLFFLGVIGEYIGTIHTQVTRRPLVVESERINF